MRFLLALALVAFTSSVQACDQQRGYMAAGYATVQTTTTVQATYGESYVRRQPVRRLFHVFHPFRSRRGC